MATTVRITETYDMKTSINKMGLVGIHTPQVALLKKLYPGLLKNHKYLRFVRCDVVGACASVLPADPLQVGVSAGDVAPEDMFNPILYTAVTNSSFDTIVARIRGISGALNVNSPIAGDMYGGSAGEVANFNTYYALLSENGRFKKSMPQSGFVIRGLVPLAHTLISNFGNVQPYGNHDASDGDVGVFDAPKMEVPTVDANTSVVADGDNAIFFRGKSIKMPRIPIHRVTTTLEDSSDIPTPDVPEIMVLAMVLPPARLHEFWYRMRVTWTIRFEEVCSTLQAGGYSVYSDVGSQSHGQNYSFAKSESMLENNTDMVSVDGVDINKIMEA